MAKHHQTAENKLNKQPTAKQGPTELVRNQAGLLELAGLSEDLISTVSDGIGAQVTWLSDSRLQTVQRQALAARIGRLQGNGHLGRAVARMTSDQNVVQRQTAVGPTTLTTTPAGTISPLGQANMRRFNALLSRGNQQQVLDFVMQVMIRRGEADPRLLVTQAVPGHQHSDCHSASLLIIDPSVNGANTISCGCMGSTGNRLPNPRIRVNFGALQSQAVTSPHPGQQFQEFLAALIHSTLFHEFRHVRQDFELCQAGGSQGTGICTDCNHPAEMDAYLSEIEAGYSPHVYRHAWVRVYTNWNYLSLGQQSIFAARRAAAEQKINRAFPRVNWATDPEVVRYQSHCQQLDRQAGGQTRGRCDSALAPVGGLPVAPPPMGDFPEPAEEVRVA
jgi:hypothetical protein